MLSLQARIEQGARWWFGTRGVRTLASRVKLLTAAFSTPTALRLWGPEMTVQIKGSPAPTVLRTDSTDRWAFLHVFIDHHYELDYGIADPSLIVDAGANVGLASIFLAIRYPVARIIASELEPGNYELLRRNLAPFSRITTKPAALWFEHTDDLTIHAPNADEWAYQAVPGRAGDGAEVATTTVQELIAEYGPIDILKLDIEGAERDVLLHAQGWIDQVQAIAVELHEDVHPDVAAAFEAATGGMPHRSKKSEVMLAHR